MKSYIDIRVMANSSDLRDFLEVLGAIQYLSAVGANRVIHLRVDGDGSADFEFHINGKRMPYTKLDTGHKDIFKFYLGE